MHGHPTNPKHLLRLFFLEIALKEKNPQKIKRPEKWLVLAYFAVYSRRGVKNSLPNKNNFLRLKSKGLQTVVSKWKLQRDSATPFSSISPKIYLCFSSILPLLYLILTHAQPAISNHGLETTVYRPLENNPRDPPPLKILREVTFGAGRNRNGVSKTLRRGLRNACFF